MALGARAIQVGTASFIRPDAARQIVAGIEAFCAARGITRLESFIGAFLRREAP
jgi:dihydroorotate dehydrogenase (NAD+) catalytic subunit